MNTTFKFVVTLLVGAVFGATGTQMLNAQTPQPAPAYYIADHEVHDAQTFGTYGARVPATLAPFGGRFLARGGKVATFQGEAPKGRIVVIAFDSLERAQAWYDSPAYQEIKPIRLKSATSRVFVVEGPTP